jgi:hypothetical protein
MNKKYMYLFLIIFNSMLAHRAQGDTPQNKHLEQYREPSAPSIKPFYSCRDVLLNASCFRDVAVNMIWQYVYTLCAMEMGLQTYIKKMSRESNTNANDERLVQRARLNLKKLQKILPAYLEGYRCAIEEFNNGELRRKLDSMKLDKLLTMDGNAQKKLETHKKP